MTELKTCPFCGGRSITLYNGKTAKTQCRSCGAEIEALTTDQVVEAWNSRAPQVERTCVNRGERLMFECSECGHLTVDGIYPRELWDSLTDEEAAQYDGEPFSFCPNCGARVVDE